MEVSATKGELAIDAELGGVRRLGWFLVLLPLGLAIFFCLLFGIATPTEAAGIGVFVFFFLAILSVIITG